MPKDDLTQLLELYRHWPCRILPNAWWKTAITHARLSIDWEPRGGVKFIRIQKGSRILSLWCAESDSSISQRVDFENIQLALVHEDCLNYFKDLKFSQSTAFFRIIHRGKIPDTVCPAGYYYEVVNPLADILHVASFINQCYKKISVNEEIVQSWLDHPVYDPKLWIWIKEAQTNQYAALGIAEIDHNIPEASLEWIQVLPNYQRNGLGRALVAELLRRVSKEVHFTTVSGELKNPTNPERLYRQMGFSGSDIWWMLSG